VTGTRSSRDTAFADIQVTETAPPADGAIATAEFLVMLGNSDSTQLDLENWQWINGVAATTLRSGSFTAQGICTAGGRRLVNPPEALALWPNAPNPFGEKSGSGANVTRIDFYLPAEMPARLDVYGALGNRLATLTQETLAKGMHTVLFDAARFDLRSGAYYILHSAEGNRLVRRMTLLR
jgi:hypothetical protein